MATEYQYPSNAELQEIAQDKIPELTMDDPIFRQFPITNQQAFLLMWEQLDNYLGLQQVRGINGEPGKIAKVGMKRYLMEPGVYGEKAIIDEREILMLRGPGTFATPLDLREIVMREQDHLLQRRIDRIRKILWDLVTTGTFTVPGVGGATVATDSYTLQTTDSTVDWATSATATPLADLRSVGLLHRGHSVSFGADAFGYANKVTINRMLGNTNAADLYGRRTSGLGTFNALPMVNQLLMGDNLPQIVEYDKGYQDDSNVFQPFIADDVVVVFGRRPGAQTVGEFRMVRNAQNPGLAPGPYMQVVDHADDGPPRNIEVHDGFNGGPVIFFPSAIVTMDVSAS